MTTALDKTVNYAKTCQFADVLKCRIFLYIMRLCIASVRITALFPFLELARIDSINWLVVVQRWLFPLRISVRSVITIIIIDIENINFFHAQLRLDVCPDMKPLHLSLNTAHSGCKWGSFMSSFKLLPKSSCLCLYTSPQPPLSTQKTIATIFHYACYPLKNFHIPDQISLD